MSEKMPDREKVIKGLECCLSDERQICSKCPYYSLNTIDDPHSACQGSEEPMRDALALLKAQEPVEPIKRENHNGFTYYHCAKCDTVLMAFQPKYCHECGRAVKWD